MMENISNKAEKPNYDECKCVKLASVSNGKLRVEAEFGWLDRNRYTGYSTPKYSALGVP
jgi:hypothetical protein